MTQPELAAKCDVSTRAFQDYEAGKRLPGAEVFLALGGMGIDLNWLLTGVGQMGHANREAGAEADATFDAQMERIQAALQDEEIPIPLERLRDRPDLDEIHQQLLHLARDPGVSKGRQAAVDLILRNVFGNRAAAARSEERLRDIGHQLREAHDLIGMAAAATGWTPPPATWQALYALAFRYRLSAEDLVFLLDAMRAELAPLSKEQG